MSEHRRLVERLAQSLLTRSASSWPCWTDQASGTVPRDPELDRAIARGRDFLVAVADGTAGIDLESLRTVRNRAWR